MSFKTPRDVLASYLAQLNDHEIHRALEHLAEEFRLEFKGGPTLSKSDLSSALGWDAGTQGRLEWSIVSETLETIAVEGEETNEFLTLLLIEPLAFRSEFRFNDDGLISHQVHDVDWTGVSVSDALAPAIEWATEHALDELAQAYPQGKMVYSEETGRRWVVLLRRWQAETGAYQPRDPSSDAP